VVFAVNHWPIAVETHSANFPGARHVCARIDQVHPSECPRIDALFASPECTHHSRARGGRLTDATSPMRTNGRSTGAWDGDDGDRDSPSPQPLEPALA
jgi:DNA (cytosine-5)-methyltransferase 1